MHATVHEHGSMDQKRLPLLLGLLLIAGTGLLYAPAIQNGFVNLDDPDYVTRNTFVKQGISRSNIAWAFGTENPGANWHPLTWISHMLDVEWYGPNPAGHHFTNVLLFSVDVFLLFLVLERATGSLLRSAAVAALFAAHPLNVESVAWIAERKSVLSIFFMLLTLLAYLWHVRKPGVGRFSLVAVCFALALMAKIMVITLPFGMLLLDYWPLGRFANAGVSGESKPFLATLRALFVEKIPLFVLSVAGGWMTLYMHHKEGALSTAMPLGWRVKNVIFSYTAYLGKIIWPSRLAVFYPHPENSLPWRVVAVAGVTLIGVTAIVVKFRKRKYLVVGWLWYLGMLFPMIGLVQSGRQGMADRYACLSLIGVFVAVVWLLGDWTARIPLHDGMSAALFVTTLLPYIFLSRTQIAYWRNSYTLFAHTLEVTRNNGIAENNFGEALVEMGDATGAVPHFENAVRLIPSLASAHYNLGISLQNENRLEDALRQYQLAINASSDHFEAAQAHNNLGVLYLDVKNLPAAKAEFSAAIALNPNEHNSYIGRGMIEQEGWDFDAAIADFSRASRITPSPLAYFWLGRALESKGEPTKAEAAYQLALQLAPGMTAAQERLATLQGRTAK
jgi:protein O-mannosyl-transferase